MDTSAGDIGLPAFLCELEFQRVLDTPVIVAHFFSKRMFAQQRLPLVLFAGGVQAESFAVVALGVLAEG